MKKLWKFTCIAAVALTLASGQAMAKTERLKYAIGFGSGAAFEAAQKYTEEFNELNKKAGYSMKLFPLSLLSLAETADGITNGVTDVGYLLTPYHPEKYPNVNMAADATLILNQFPEVDRRAGSIYSAVMTDYIMNHCPDCQNEFSKQKQVFLGGVSSSSYVLMCLKPTTTLEDIKGKKIRVGGVAWARWVQNFGATPVTMPGNEGFEALNHGVVDCAVYSAAELTGFGLHSVVKAITLKVPGGVYAGGGTSVINADVWKKMPDQVRLNTLQVASKSAARTPFFYEQIAAADLKAAEKNGIRISEPSPDFLKASQEFSQAEVERIVKSYEQQYGVTNGEEKLETLKTLLKKWIDLVANIDDENELISVYQNEIYKNVDLQRYGM